MFVYKNKEESSGNQVFCGMALGSAGLSVSYLLNNLYRNSISGKSFLNLTNTKLTLFLWQLLFCHTLVFFSTPLKGRERESRSFCCWSNRPGLLVVIVSALGHRVIPAAFFLKIRSAPTSKFELYVERGVKMVNSFFFVCQADSIFVDHLFFVEMLPGKRRFMSSVFLDNVCAKK